MASSSAPDISSRRELERVVTDKLHSGGVASAPAEARWLVESVAGGVRRSGERALEREQIQAALELAQRRVAGEPLQYLTGTAGFRYLELAVGPGVFIPRPETELVVENALEKLPLAGTLVDVGTGSGAIALAVAHERPDARVLATESSLVALRWAERNRSALSLNVEMFLGDLFAGLPAELRGAVDVVVSNPPYVSEEDRATLPRDVVDHEPHDALFSGPQGLELTRRLSADARSWLQRGGWLVLEVAADRGTEVAGMLRSLGYSDVSVRRDLAGRERIAAGRSSARRDP